MSDVSININFSNDTSHRRTVTQNQKRKNKKFRKKQQYLKQRSNLESKCTPTHSGRSGNDQIPLHNGAPTKHQPLLTSTQNKGLLRPDTTTSASHFSFKPSVSTHTLPSWAFTVKSKGSYEKPKEPVNTQSAATTSTPEVNKSLPHPSSSASASHCSSKPLVSTHTLPSWAFTVNTKGSHERPKEPANTKSTSTDSSPSVSSSHKITKTPDPSKYLAIDCEMVGTGPKGSISQLARCSIVSYEGDVVYDKFINPSMPVTDYRTRWSGIRRSDLIKATPYAQARKEILRLLIGKVVIGHAVHNDFKVLSYTHPTALTRDTSRIPLLNLKAGFAENECASLKRLTKAIFNRDIQNGKKGHSSVEDARATMELYKVVEEEWERRLAS